MIFRKQILKIFFFLSSNICIFWKILNIPYTSQIKFKNPYKAYSKTYFVKKFWKKLTYHFHCNSDLKDMPIKIEDDQGSTFLAPHSGQTSDNLFAPATANVFWKRFYPNFMPTAKILFGWNTLCSPCVTSCNRIFATNCEVSYPCTPIITLWKMSVVFKT